MAVPGVRIGRAGPPARTRAGILRFVKLIQAEAVLESLARVATPDDRARRVGLVQHEWTDDPGALVETLRDGIRTAAEAGARIVFLPELTLSRYPADTPPQGTPSDDGRGPRDRPDRRLRPRGRRATSASTCTPRSTSGPRRP